MYAEEVVGPALNQFVWRRSEEESGEESDSEEDNEDFNDEPRGNGPSNVVEAYGIESVPADEDMEKGQSASRFRTMNGDDPNRSKKIAALLCCCVVILVVIGIVLGVVLSKKNNKKPASKPKAPPTLAPVTLPVPPPTPLPTTGASTMPIPAELNITADADTFIFLSNNATLQGPFGNETSLLVQNDVGQAAAVSLMTFNVSQLPPVSALSGYTKKAFLTLTVMEAAGTALTGNVTLDTMRLPSNSANIEAFTSNISSAIESIKSTQGPSFEILPGEVEAMVDISSLVFGGQLIIRRRMQTQQSELFLALMDTVSAEAESVRFYSSESAFPPRLEIRLMGPSPSPTLSAAPSTSAAPSSAPSVSNAPSVSAMPSLSFAPSLSPSISAAPSKPFICSICVEGNITSPAAALTLPQIGNTTCEGLQQVANTGAVTEANCTLLQPIVNGTCCAAVAPQPFYCDICSGGNVTNPSGVVTIPQQPNTTCAQYDALGTSGSIGTAQCAGLQMITKSICCL